MEDILVSMERWGFALAESMLLIRLTSLAMLLKQTLLQKLLKSQRLVNVAQTTVLVVDF